MHPSTGGSCGSRKERNKVKLTLLLITAAQLLPAASQVAYTLTPNATFSIFDAAGTELAPAPSPGKNLSILFSRDGKTAWSTSRTGDLYAIDVATKRLGAVLPIQASTPVISPDGARLYMYTATGLVAVDTATATVVGTLPLFSLFLSVSPDSLHVYSTDGNQVTVVDATTMTISNQYTISGVHDIAALPDNRSAAIRVNNVPADAGPILRLDLATGATTTISNELFTSFILSSNGEKILGLLGGDLLIVDIASGNGQFENNSVLLQTLCASPNGAKVYGTTATGLFTIDLVSNTQVNTIAGATPFACAVTPDSSRVWMANDAANEIDKVNVGTKKLTGVIETSGGSPMVLTPDGSKLFVSVAPALGGIAVYDTATGMQIPQSLDISPLAMAVSPDGTEVVAEIATQFDNVAVIDVATLTITFNMRSEVIGSTSVVFSPDGSRYYINGQDTVSGTYSVKAYDSATNLVIGSTSIAFVRSNLAISPDGKTIYTGYAGGLEPTRIAAFDALTLKNKGITADTLPVNKGFVVSNDGSSLFAIGGTNATGVFVLSAVSTATLKVTNSITLTGLNNGTDSQMLTLSPDGTQLYVSDLQQTWLVNTSDLSLAQTTPLASISPYLFGPQ